MLLKFRGQALEQIPAAASFPNPPLLFNQPNYQVLLKGFLFAVAQAFIVCLLCVAQQAAQLCYGCC